MRPDNMPRPFAPEHYEKVTHVDVLREMLECRAKWGEEQQAAALKAAIAALEAVEGAKFGFMDIESGRVCVVERHDHTPLAGFRDVLIILADALGETP